MNNINEANKLQTNVSNLANNNSQPPNTQQPPQPPPTTTTAQQPSQPPTTQPSQQQQQHQQHQQHQQLQQSQQHQQQSQKQQQQQQQPLTSGAAHYNKTYRNPFCVAYINNELYNPNDDTGKQFVPPTSEPVNGKVWPMYLPPDSKPHRNTNQLQYLLKMVHKVIVKHKHAWPFETPVDTKNLKLPDYHTIIKKPMDFTTVKKRLEHFWYYDAYECIEDFKQVFVNCYIYNKPTEDVVMMAHQVEELFLDKLEEMPSEEVVLEIPPPKQPKHKRKGAKKPNGKYQDGGTPIINRTSSINLLQNNVSSNIDGSSNQSQHLDSISPALSNSNQSLLYTQDASQGTNSSHLTDSKPSIAGKLGNLTAYQKANDGNTIPATSQSHLSNHNEASNASTSRSIGNHGLTSPDAILGKNLFFFRDVYFYHII